MGVYDAVVVNWLDGDTVVASVKLDHPDLDLHFWMVKPVRVFGINAPEIHSADPLEKASGQASKAFAEQLAPTTTPIKLGTTKEKDKYGRMLASVVTLAGVDVAKEMVVHGHAKQWDGKGKKPV